MSMMQLAEVARALSGNVVGADVAFDAVCADSRTVKGGDLFVALSGARFDGHDFVPQAARAGAAAALVRRERAAALASALPLAVVHDTTTALGALAQHWRRRFDIPLVAVAGSNGKTTVKEMTASCLREQFGESRVLAAHGNFNNHIGLPLTVLALRGEHRAAVVEIGMNHPGETAHLAGIARPTIALVNNAQREHLEFMHSVAEVAAEHGTLIASLPADGVAVINADDAYASDWRSIAGGRRVCDFALDAPAVVHASFRLTESGSEIQVRAPDGEACVTLRAPGRHNVSNAAAAIAAAITAGASLDACARALSHFMPIAGRMQRRAGVAGARLLDDTYNANPDSVRAAVDVLAGAAGRKLLVLGDMGEVGARGADYHKEIGEYARVAGVDRLFTFGDIAANATRAFGAGARHFTRMEDLLADVEGALAPDATLLVKGSRFMKMERVIKALVCEMMNDD